MPGHLGVIMDGNRRWAQMRSLPPERGWEEGEQRLHDLTRAAADAGVGILTVFAFSRENWQRSGSEVESLMGQLSRAMLRRHQQLLEQGVRVKFIGARDRLSPQVVRRMEKIEADTAAKEATVHLIVALDYGGDWDFVQAMRAAGRDCVAGKLSPDELDHQVLGRYMQMADYPPVDLLIRTGGEQRISNFLLRELAYAELYFTACLWPDFRQREFRAALTAYAQRQRRFGGDL